MASLRAFWLLAAMPAAERDQLYRERFDQIDTNHDGKLSVQEIAQFLREKRAARGETP